MWGNDSYVGAGVSPLPQPALTFSWQLATGSCASPHAPHPARPNKTLICDAVASNCLCQHQNHHQHGLTAAAAAAGAGG
jgi:hypothetical protein